MSTLGIQLSEALTQRRQEGGGKVEGTRIEQAWRTGVQKLEAGIADKPVLASRAHYLRIIFENPDTFLREDMGRCNEETKAAFKSTVAYINKKYGALIEEPAKKEFPWTKHLPR